VKRFEVLQNLLKLAEVCRSNDDVARRRVHGGLERLLACGSLPNKPAILANFDMGALTLRGASSHAYTSPTRHNDSRPIIPRQGPFTPSWPLCSTPAAAGFPDSKVIALVACQGSAPATPSAAARSV